MSDAEGAPVGEGFALKEGLVVEEAEARVVVENDAHADSRADADGEPVL